MLVFSLLLACEGGEMDMSDSPCMEETRASTLEQGATFDGDTFSVQVEALSPATPVVGENTWELAIPGSSGCSVDLVHTMPDHGHGGPLGDVESMGADVWEVQDLEFTMGGYWEIDVEITCDDALSLVPMALCVDA
ncbi:MAG: hypothetical protein ACI9VR_004525 [Cognaticolwellia sp.]|jgi:hypothetical protein